MMTSSNGNIFGVTAPLCGNSPVTGEFPTQKPVTWSFGVFFDLRLNKRLSKQSRGWWSETPPRSLWRQCNGDLIIYINDVTDDDNSLMPIYHQNIDNHHDDVGRPVTVIITGTVIVIMWSNSMSEKHNVRMFLLHLEIQ